MKTFNILFIILLIILAFGFTSCSPCRWCAKQCPPVIETKEIHDTTIIRVIDKEYYRDIDSSAIRALDKQWQLLYSSLRDTARASTTYSSAAAWVDSATNLLNLFIKNKDSAKMPIRYIYNNVYHSEDTVSISDAKEKAVQVVYKMNRWQNWCYSCGLVLHILLVLFVLYSIYKLYFKIRHKIRI